MKKQFFRVKQLADQTFLRAEKSEILNHEELQVADQKVEFLRGAITSITKKIAPSGPTNDLEKLVKKVFEYQLGTSFIEEGKQGRECQLFQQVLKEAGIIEQQLAREFAEHEMKVEEMVYTPLQNVLETEFPNITKHKHNLRKYCLDKDSASNRYHVTRKETLKEDMEEADTKVEQSRDMLAIDMFNILAKENEFSEYVLQLLKLQRGYHESALKNLETIIPQLEKKIGDSPVRRVFGTALQEHLRITGKKIAYPLEICITALSDYGMLEEGLFRVAASATKVKRLKSAIDSGCFSFLIPEYRDAHVLANILKLYLRELPEPLLTYHLHKEWIEAMQSQGNQRLGIIKTIVEKLPQENKINLSYLFHFLLKLTQHSENKMSPSNIAIVLSPNLLWTKNEKENINIENCVLINMVIELLIKEVKFLFPDDSSQYVSVTKFFQDEEIVSNNKINSDMDIKNGSPRPNLRKKKSAPVPPINEKIVPSKFTNVESRKVNVGINTDDSIEDKLLEDNLLSEQNIDQQRKKCSKNIDAGYSTDSCKGHIQKVDGQPIHKTYKTVVSHVVVNQLNTPSSNQVLTHKCTDSNSDKNLLDFENRLRKSEFSTRSPKPEVPARPLSLSKKSSSESVFKKTHCSVYNVADKLQPSIINIETNTEKFTSKPLVHMPDKNPKLKEFGDKSGCVNLDCPEEIPAAKIESNQIGSSELLAMDAGDIKKTKSNEHLHLNDENKNCSKKYNHMRAKSDGGIAELEPEKTFLKMSSFNLIKPVHPPPPPPNK